jgi:hypothetical protein
MQYNLLYAAASWFSLNELFWSSFDANYRLSMPCSVSLVKKNMLKGLLMRSIMLMVCLLLWSRLESIER